jgi:pilus assembly protein CpaE
MDYFLLHATQGEVKDWLGKVLGGQGTLVTEGGAQEAFLERAAQLRPGLVFLHFSAELAGASARLGEQLLRLFPGLPLVAVGHADEPGIMLAALRVGVKDFIDLRDAPADAEAVVKRLAVNLAAAARRHLPLNEKTDARAEVLLLDLGLPARDGALYLNLSPGFHFVEAVRNLRRFDQVFVQTALTRHGNGVCVLPLPAALGELRDISYSEASSLLERLRAFFDMQIIDLGGFGNAEFTAQIVKAADSVVLVADQSVGAIVSAAELVHELRAREVERDDLHLLVSRFDARLGVDAAQIAQRVGVQSVGTLPDSRAPLVLAMNRGAVLADDDPHDPYVRALADLLARLGYRPAQARETSLLARMKDKLPEALRAVRVARTGS